MALIFRRKIRLKWLRPY